MDTDTGKRQKNDKFASGAENAFGATGRAAEQHYPRMALGFKAQMQAKLFLEATERANDAARTRGASTAEWARCYAIVALHGSRSPPGKAPPRRAATSAKPPRPDDPPRRGARAEERCSSLAGLLHNLRALKEPRRIRANPAT